MDGFDDNFKKGHRAPKAGRKAEKKKEANLKKKGMTGDKKKRISTAESNPKVHIYGLTIDILDTFFPSFWIGSLFS